MSERVRERREEPSSFSFPEKSKARQRYRMKSFSRDELETVHINLYTLLTCVQTSLDSGEPFNEMLENTISNTHENGEMNLAELLLEMSVFDLRSLVIVADEIPVAVAQARPLHPEECRDINERALYAYSLDPERTVVLSVYNREDEEQARLKTALYGLDEQGYDRLDEALD